jgi:hypothetical protein
MASDALRLAARAFAPYRGLGLAVFHLSQAFSLLRFDFTANSMLQARRSFNSKFIAISGKHDVIQLIEFLARVIVIDLHVFQPQLAFLLRFRVAANPSIVNPIDLVIPDIDPRFGGGGRMEERPDVGVIHPSGHS